MDYKNTVFLPKTDFPMKASLPQKEAEILATWQQANLYEALKAQSKKDIFMLHDGPPYANGHLHIGHALNKILKDVVMKYQRMLGKKAPYIPGWDCHGLPIEWMVETEYKKQGKNKDHVPVIEFRSECRNFAAKWVGIQAQEFQRLGVLGDWKNPYITMDFTSEAAIVQEIFKFLMNGGLYKGVRPIQWSVIEKTALAEAEVEYKDKTSPSIYVGFPVVKTGHDLLKDTEVVIWTTTPWTIPGNRAIAYHSDVAYQVLLMEDHPKLKGKKYVVAKDLVPAFLKEVEVNQHQVLGTVQGSDLAGTIAHHPFHGQGYDFDVPLLAGDHVTTDQGTGFVHTAPGHGVEDFAVGQKYGIEIPQTVGDDGVYYDHVPLFKGIHVFKANEPVMQALEDVGALLHKTEIFHSYPHSWRSKAPLIFRTTPQWFISMEANDLRSKALEAIKKTKWIPSQGENRITSMIATRPDWCLSRQRAWGVPIALFVHKETGQPLKDDKVNQRIYEAIAKDGSDLWFEAGVEERFLAPDHNPKDYEKCQDIVDVWFESGCTHSFVLEGKTDLAWPADLYLEGSDQHRGWFHSSLLESVGTRGVAPYKAVLTHGFVVDAQGYKMSKSQGNAVSLDELIEKHGADILRLWVLGSDYSEDLRIGSEIIKRQEDIYRKLRNTFRYILGNITGVTIQDISYDQLPSLEKWVLHRLSELDQVVREKSISYDFHGLFKELYQFCAVDLSALYFDIRKDTLYCDSRNSKACQSTLYILKQLFDHLTRWFAPILSFTAEEVWRTYHGANALSIHLEDFSAVPKEWHQPDLGKVWDQLRDIRRVVTGAIERERAQGHLGSSLQAGVSLYLDNHPLANKVHEFPLAEIMIASHIEVVLRNIPDGAFVLEDVPHVGAVIFMAPGTKCARCWRVLEEVGNIPSHQDICNRCHEAVLELE